MYKKQFKPLRCCVAAALLAALLFTAGCGLIGAEKNAGKASPAPTLDTIAAEGYRGENDEEPEASQTFREATLYFVSDEGFVVPVKKLIPWEEGIAKACLGYMTSTPDNDRAAAELGLKTVLPAETRVSIAISNGVASVDLSGMAPLASAEEESNMLTAVVDTLTEFATVDKVTVTVNGSGGTMANGTPLPKEQPARPLNAERTELEASAGAVAGTLYFPNSGGALTIPVTRYFSSSPSLYTKVNALIAGPKSPALRCCFPQGTLLLGATAENGVVTINLSEDFKLVAETAGLYTLARETLLLTLSEDMPVKKLVIQVNGVEYMPE